AEVGATTSTDVSIEDPALPDCGCSEINRRNSSMLQSMETKFAILFFQIVFFVPGPNVDREAGRNAPSKPALRTAAIAQYVGLGPHSKRRRLRPSPLCRSSRAVARGGAQPTSGVLRASAGLCP